MTEPPHATVRDVAARAGVSPMTVTRALRGDKCVAAATRARVAQAAAALSYRANPTVSSVMSYIHRRRVAAFRGKIVWLNAGVSSRVPSDFPWEQPLYEGVQKRVEQSGYLLESIWLNDPRLQPDRLTDILIARGAQGLIVPELHPCLDRLQWDRFACATTVPSGIAPPIHLASSDFLHGLRECLARLRRLGYSRIGLMLHPVHDRATQGLLRALYIFETAGRRAKHRLPVLLLPESAGVHGQVTAWGNWLRRYRPEAVICRDEHVLDWTRALGIAVPGKLGLVHLDRHPYLTQWAGIDQREDQIGAAAADLVVGQLVRGEIGLPPFQKEVLIKGEWVEGATLRPRRRTRPAPSRAWAN